jgi:hypothetical protein
MAGQLKEWTAFSIFRRQVIRISAPDREFRDDHRTPSSSKLSSMPLRSISRIYRTLPWLAACVLFVCAAGWLPSPAQAQSSDDQEKKTPLPLKPAVPGVQVNHRLILKDGTYQVVRKYEIQGDRVRYISIERSGDWEEIPYSLIDWVATRKWEQQAEQAAAEAQSPAMQEAAEIDKEEAAERMAQKDRMPEVARGLNLPNQDGVFVLDEYQGSPQLVELVPSTGDLQMARQHGIRSVLPLQGQVAHVELEGQAAKVHLHVNEPTLYLSLDSPDDARVASEQVTANAITVDTRGASQVAHPKRGAASATSGFAIVRVDERKSVRIVGTVHVSPTGNITQEENVIPMTAEVLPGKHWLKLKPTAPLLIGEYALIEILSPKDMNATVWDFQVNPRAGLNETAIGPIDSK